MPRYQVQRSIEIKATPEEVFDVVADFGTWTRWSPWLCAEPDAHVTVTSAASSVGSVYAWKGEIVGQGEIEHRQLQKGKLIDDEIRFLKPFRSKATVAFEMEAVTDGTRLTWHMRGSLPLFLFWMKSQIEVFIRMDYERGLRMLKEWMETGQVLSKTNIRGMQGVGPLSMLGVRRQCRVQDVGVSVEKTLAEAKQHLQASHLPIDGQMITVYHHFDVPSQTFDYTCGFVLPSPVAAAPSGLFNWSLPNVQALCVEHTGSYDHLGNAWSAANQFARYKKLKQSKAGAFELYMNDPDSTEPADLLTKIYLPVK
jgi:effector-binding domain-containing protein